MHHRPDTTKSTSISRIAILTSGGETPGMNSAIRAVVRTAAKCSIEVIGVHRGFAGLLQQDFSLLDSLSVSRIIQGGGTILRCGSCKDFYLSEIRQLCANVLRDHQIDALIVIGGAGSLQGAYLLSQETDIRVIGIPGTIENDIAGCEDSIGFDTAVNTAVEAIDKLQDTAFSHQRLFLVEVAGTNSGFVAAEVALAIGAEMLIVPEHKVDIAQIAEQLSLNLRSGLPANGMVVLAEGSAQPKLMQKLVDELKARGEDPRICVLGHIQRGGAPTAHDRSLAAALGNAAIHYLLNGATNCLIGVEQNAIKSTPLGQIVNSRKPLPRSALELVEELGR